MLGQTSVIDWQKKIRGRPGPWAELACDKLILTLPSAAIRGLDDPEPAMRHWVRVLDADATLAGRPLQHRSPERIRADRQISVGYMHSGYPIMTHLDVATRFADVAKLKTIDGGWGLYHELGHNHQSADWTFPGTGEVTVNLFTMYTLETVCGISPAEATGRALTADGATRRSPDIWPTRISPPGAMTRSSPWRCTPSSGWPSDGRRT